MVKRISELYADARRVLLNTEDPNSASLLARDLLSHVTGMTREQLLADREKYVSQDVCDAVDACVQRIVKGEPLAYVLGEWEFYGLKMQVDRNVLIPRDDTCAVAGLAIKKALFLDQNPRILDLCTGSGCIGLAVASRVKDAKVTLADLSRDALAVAKRNITLNKLSGRVSCVQVDAMAEPPAFLGKFDLIVSNPPYITGQEMEQLPVSVKDYEPHMALYGGDDGLDFYRAISKNFASVLKPGGFLCYEFGMGQGDDVCAILEEDGYTILERTRDYNNRERAVLAQYGRKED